MSPADLTELLIELVKEYPIIYDPEHLDFKNLRKKDKVWSQVGQVLQINGEEAKKKWRNLRDSYAKYQKCLLKTDVRSGKKNYKRWQWAGRMDFLKPHLTVINSTTNLAAIKLEETELNIENENQDNSEPLIDIPENTQYENSQSSYPIQEEPECYYTPGRKKENEFDKSNFVVDKILEYFEQKTKYTDLDATELLFLGYAKTVKTFSPRRQIITKMKMAQLIMEQELEHYGEESHSLVTKFSSNDFKTSKSNDT